MNARRLLPLLLLLLVAAPAATAKGRDAGLLTVRPDGLRGRLVLYDLRTLRTALRLPPGLLSADGRSFLAVRVAGTRTLLTRYVLPSGRVTARGSVAGRHRLAALSADGSRAVLAAARPGPGRTGFAVVGTSGSTVLRRVSLRGSYGVEALSADGRRLFLIRYGRGDYNLRLYDLRTRRLSFTPLVEGAGAFEKMVGTPWTSDATRDGRWLLTLYIKSDGRGFVHALDLRSAIGHCLDLPHGFASARTIRGASLVLSPDERRLYLASPLAGRLLVLAFDPPRIVREVRFRNDGGSRLRGVAAAVSARGTTVAFALDGRIWRYRIGERVVNGPGRVSGRVVGLGFSPDGRRLVVVRRDAPAAVLDAATGRPVARR